MKQKIISTLKKEILVVELPENTQFDVLINNPLWKDGIKFLTGTEEKFHFIKGSYTLLGLPDEIKEEDVVDLCDRIGINNPLADCDFFVHYGNDDTMFETALESFNSALLSEIYWNVNPASFDDNEDDPEIRREMRYRWELAEEKTFDRNRVKIFFKN